MQRDRFTYHVELDNSTETIRTIERLDSWQQKLHRYHQYAIDCRDRVVNDMLI